MTPDLELIENQSNKSFRLFTHDYPHIAAKWHFHPEYELHHITASVGKYFVGDYIGIFEPGQLILTGPNLPHNWVSELPDERAVINRDIVLQFSAGFIDGVLAVLPDLAHLKPLLHEAKRGVLFAPETGMAAQSLLTSMLTAEGFPRIQQFFTLLDLLSSDANRCALAGVNYVPDPDHFMSSTINQVLAAIDEQLASDLRETDFADLAGMSVTTFSRFFRKQLKISFVQYVTQLRINRSCKLLMETDLSITEICFLVGFNNVSNFNRHFLALRQIPPSRFRAYHQTLHQTLGTGLSSS